MFLATLAFWLVNRFSKPAATKNRTHVFWRFLNYVIALAILSVSLLTYPLISTIFITLSALGLLWQISSIGLKESLSKCFYNVAIFALASVIFITTTKYFLHPTVSYQPNDGPYSFSLPVIDWDRFSFALNYLLSSFAIWDIFGSFIAIYSLFAECCWRGVWQKCRHGDWRDHHQNTCMDDDCRNANKRSCHH